MHPPAEWDMLTFRMATWVLGDVHGCFATLEALLARLEVDWDRDRLWLVGDLVNRGPSSLAALRWAKGLSERMGPRLVAVLGNHDLRLVACHAGIARPRPRDTLDGVLAAPDREELVGWLASRPLLHREGDTALVHAGLLPGWTLEEGERRARRVEAALAGPLREALLQPPPAERPDPVPTGIRQALAAFTLLRTLGADGRPCPFSGPPAAAPAGCVPWFRAPGRRSEGATVVFGHWAALGLLVEPRLVAVDTGCVWGQRLTAIRLDDRAVVQEEASERRTS